MKSVKATYLDTLHVHGLSKFCCENVDNALRDAILLRFHNWPMNRLKKSAGPHQSLGPDVQPRCGSPKNWATDKMLHLYLLARSGHPPLQDNGSRGYSMINVYSLSVCWCVDVCTSSQSCVRLMWEHAPLNSQSRLIKVANQWCLSA